MSSSGQYSGYCREDLLRYVSGTMLPAEMHALEKAALEDPFLADALEGLLQEDAVAIQHNLEKLDERLAKKKHSNRIFIPAQRSIWRWAAAAVLIGMIGIAAYFISQNNNQEPAIAKLKESSRLDTVLPKSEDQPATATIEANERKIDIQNKDEKNRQVEPIEPDQTLKPALAQADKMQSEPKESAPVRRDEDEVNIKTSKSISPAEAAKDEAIASQGAKSEITMPAMRQRSGIAEKEQGVYYYTGQIINTQNQPLPFANISILPSQKLSYSDVHGNFRVVAGDSNLQLEIKAEGYIPQIIQLNKLQSNQRIFLQTASADKKKIKTRLRIKEADTSGLQITEEKREFAEAEPRDGYENYEWYLRNNIRITGEIKNYQNGGYVEISFMVSENGRLSAFRVEKSLCTACDNEVIRLIKEGPPWQIQGRKAPIRSRISVVF